MNLAANPYSYIPRPAFRQDREPIESQWREWRKAVKEVHFAFKFLSGIQARSYIDQDEFRASLKSGPKAMSEKYHMVVPGSPEAVAEACRRLLIFMDGDPMDGDPSVNKYGMTPWECQILL